MDHSPHSFDLELVLDSVPHVKTQASPWNAMLPNAALRKELCSDRFSPFLPQPLANPGLEMTVIRYSRGQMRDGGRSVERQRLALDEWFADQDIKADECWIEYADGSKVNVCVEGVLRRAEGGEAIWPAVEDASRITRNSEALSEFFRRAEACGIRVSVLRD